MALKYCVALLLFVSYSAQSMEITNSINSVGIQIINSEIKEQIFFACDEASQSKWKFLSKDFYTFYKTTRNKQKKYVCDLIELCKNDDLFDICEFTRYATTQGICGYYTRSSICNCFKLADTVENNKAIYHKVTEIVRTALFDAIKKKSPFAMYLCVKQNSNDLYTGISRETPAIIEATRYGFYDGVLQLLGIHSNVDATNKNGMTALMWAATKKDNLQIGKLLIDFGANVDVIDESGTTALMVAGCHGNIRMLKLLIAEGANLEATDNYGDTALIESAGGGRVAMVKLLIAAGANLYAVSRWGKTAFMVACGTEIEKLLIDAGAK